MDFNDFYSEFTGSNYERFANAEGVIQSAPPQSVLRGQATTRERAADGSKDATGGLFKGIGDFLGSESGKAVLAGVKAGTTTPLGQTPAGQRQGEQDGDGNTQANFWQDNKTVIIVGGVLILGVSAFLIFRK